MGDFVLQRYTKTMPRPKGVKPPRVYISARVRKDLVDLLTEATADENPTRSRAVEMAIEMWLRERGLLAAPEKPDRKPAK